MGVKQLMRYNNYVHDPLSFDPLLAIQNPEWAIAARDDLLPGVTVASSNRLGQWHNRDLHSAAVAMAFGNTDAKLVSSADVKALRFEVIVGPTHQSLPPFSWINASHSMAPGLHVAHAGHPLVFDFDWNFF